MVYNRSPAPTLFNQSFKLFALGKVPPPPPKKNGFI